MNGLIIIWNVFRSEEHTSELKSRFDLVCSVFYMLSLHDALPIFCEGNTERQVQAIARSIKDVVEEKGLASVKRMEGFEQARWILVDIGDIVCHIFHKDERSHYNLERLWGDAQQVALHIGQEK